MTPRPSPSRSLPDARRKQPRHSYRPGRRIRSQHRHHVSDPIRRDLRFAIRAYCLACQGHCAKEVRHCTVPACPLYACRPYQGHHHGGAK